jgi:hypothetical protein
MVLILQVIYGRNFFFPNASKMATEKSNLAAEFTAYYPQGTETQVSKNLHLPFQVEIRQLRIICMGMAS